MADFPNGVVDKEGYATLTELDNFGVGLTDWEKDFVESLLKQLKQGKTLTDKQYGTLLKIKALRVK